MSADSWQTESICAIRRRSAFVLDQSIEYGVHMTHLINEVTKDLDTDEDTEQETEEQL